MLEKIELTHLFQESSRTLCKKILFKKLVSGRNSITWPFVRLGKVKHECNKITRTCRTAAAQNKRNLFWYIATILLLSCLPDDGVCYIIYPKQLLRVSCSWRVYLQSVHLPFDLSISDTFESIKNPQILVPIHNEKHCSWYYNENVTY